MSTTASEAIRGNTGLYAMFKLDGAQPVDYSIDIKAMDISGEDADDSDLTFAEGPAGGAQADTVTVTAIQSTAAGSLWRFLWENAGKEAIIDYGPHGNAVPSANKPHFRMRVKLGLRPKIGGEAKRDKTRQDFETTFEVLEGPILDDDGVTELVSEDV